VVCAHYFPVNVAKSLPWAASLEFSLTFLAGVIAGYLHFKWHKVESKMEGLTAGIMASLAHLIVTWFMTIGSTAIYGGDWGSTMES
jgi:hypothetical protein